jgi:hypothetical protein
MSCISRIVKNYAHVCYAFFTLNTIDNTLHLPIYALLSN